MNPKYLQSFGIGCKILLLVCMLFYLPTYGQTDSAATKAVPPIDSDNNQTSASSKFNEFFTRFSSFKLGMGYIGDYVTYHQSETFKRQMDSAKLELTPMFKTRDFRFFFSGKINIKRELAWKASVMYDGNLEDWLLRETGITIGVPELFGHFFIGRTKEGFSMVKVMNGHSPWTAERQMALDVIPILADGVKWMGHIPGPEVFWNIGYFNDVFSKGHTFSTHAWQIATRVGFLPIYKAEKNEALHLAVNFRYGQPLNGQIVLKSRPESNPTPQLINTGTFAADQTINTGIEMYYSTSKFLAGSELLMHRFYSPLGDHQFLGGDMVVSYIFNGFRPYKTAGSIFGFVTVQKPVTKKGWGTWEGVLRLSSLNLNDGDIRGGKFWRLTPMVNWYMTQKVRLEFIYGYGVLDRYSLAGNVQFFQTRLQLSVF